MAGPKRVKEQEKKKPAEDVRSRPEPTSDAVEGDLDTIEESIKEHEKKHDQNS